MNYFNELLHSLPKTINSELEAATLLTKFKELRKPSYELLNDTNIFCHINDLDEVLDFYKYNFSKIKEIRVLGLENEIAHQAVKVLPYSPFTQQDIIHLYFKQDLRPAVTAYRELSEELAKHNIQEYTIESKCLSKFYKRNSFVFINNMLQSAIESYNILEDAISRYTYLALWKSRLEQKPGYIPIADFPQYWHPLVSAKEGDIICEGGPANGGTTINFSKKLNNNCQIIAFEPDQVYLSAVQQNCQNYSNITIVPKGLYNFTGTLYINTNNYTKVVKQKISDNDYECPVTSIDDYFLNSPFSRVDLIKLDVEGAKLKTMEGAKEILLRDKPKLAISIYHNTIDFISIPELLRKMPINYKYYISHHRPWYAETILYAIAK